jgi:hypothetical protein
VTFSKATESGDRGTYGFPNLVVQYDIRGYIAALETEDDIGEVFKVATIVSRSNLALSCERTSPFSSFLYAHMYPWFYTAVDSSKKSPIVPLMSPRTIVDGMQGSCRLTPKIILVPVPSHVTVRRWLDSRR